MLMPVIRGNARNGPPIVTISVMPPSGFNQSILCRALLDTGADGTSINRSVATAAALPSRGKLFVTGIGGSNYHRAWIARIGFQIDPALGGLPYVLEEPVQAIEMPEYHAFEAIIGRDILMLGDFHLRANGDFTLDLPG